MNTRVQWQKETWVKNVDHVYLSEPVGEEIYTNVAKKYAKFFIEYEGDCDWFFFCDDDTFVYTERLKLLLGNYSKESPLMIGFKGGEFPIYNLKVGWCSGGAGMALSKTLVYNVRDHLRTTNYIITDESDTSLGIWCTQSGFLLIDRKDMFCPVSPQCTELKGCITYHYCSHEDFMNLNKK